MLPLTIPEIVRATQGSLVIGDPASPLQLLPNPPLYNKIPMPWPPTGISIDSKSVRKGELFFAIKGKRHNANQFLNEVIARGVSACFISEIPQSLNVKLYDFPTIIKVRDTRQALSNLAKFYREKYGATTCMVTVNGSCGKTTVKEMISQILNQNTPIAYSPANYNNEIGCPLSLFYLSPEHRYGVFELGSSKKGEVQFLSQLVQPQVAVLTNIRLEHSATFGNLDQIAEGESEVFSTLRKDGIAILPQDDSYIDYLKSKVPSHCSIWTYGLSPNSSVTANTIRQIDGKTTFTITYKNIEKKTKESFECQIPILGQFNVLNATAAVTTCLSLKIPIQSIQEGLKIFSPPPMRFEIIKSHGAILVNDSYNANPGSVYSSIESFIKSFPNLTKTIVLGDMLELGKYSQEEHEKIGIYLKKLPFSTIVLTGTETKTTYDYLRKEPNRNQTVVYTHDREDLIKKLKPHIRTGNALLFKASHALHLEEIVEKIR